MHQIQLLKVEQVASMLSASKSHVWAQSKEVPDFPKPLKLSAKQTRWKQSDINAFIEQRASQQH